MSGHSKWSTIKHKKAARDAKRGNVFTKIANGIAIAVKRGGSGDPDVNFSLRLMMEKARAANMPNENIKRAIARGMGKGADGKELEEVMLEGYAPEGVAVLVTAVTDNRNRTVAEIKTLFDKHGGRIAEPGSVLFQFERVGVVSYEGKLGEEESLELIEKGVREIEEDDGGGELLTDPGAVGRAGEYLREAGYQGVEEKVVHLPHNEVEAKDANKIERLLETLDEHDDVQEVYANLK